MLDNKRFEECVFALCEVYGKEAPSASWLKITKACMDSEGVATKEFEAGVFQLMKTKSSKDVFNLPSPADFLEVIGKKPKSIETIAQEKAQEAMSTADRMRIAPLVQYDCPITNWVIQNSFDGVASFCWKLDKTNPNREADTVWMKKRFIEEYINAHSRGCGILHPIKNVNHAVVSYDDILQIGDKSVCESNKLLAIQNKNMISSSKSQEQVAKITTQYKKG